MAERLRVESSHLRSVQWDPATRELEVEFHQGRVYRYSGVTYDTWTRLQRAPSKGSFVRREIAPKHAAKEVIR